ncbi:anthranilate synthase component I [Neoconidiobolus thromboides FSU 785]|nr:anthranilate synthase component I [Neoconidiobolus thromboides FSU 785]
MKAIIPSFEEARKLIESQPDGNILPVYKIIFADLLNPFAAYLKLVDYYKDKSKYPGYSFLFESVKSDEKIGRYSLIGCDPYKIVISGEDKEIKGDPLIEIEKYLSQYNYISVNGLPEFTGGAVGYISFDCVKYFEPRTARKLKDPLGIPESVHMYCKNVIIFDHLFQKINVITHIKGDLKDSQVFKSEYENALLKLDEMVEALTCDGVPLPDQVPITETNLSFKSNVGKEGYENFVNILKDNIKNGEIIQAVPSQRLSRPTQLHPFNVYRYLRTVNPSPYLFYLDCADFQVVGASPEMLVKVDLDNKVYTHPIAGTRRRGKTAAEDLALEKDLLSDIKETSEHVMLVDLGRNDVNRVAQPGTVKVDSLMHIEKYSHVMHIVSNVSGTLREECNRFDAFRSVFPAGTVSGAPKVRALELIGELEGEKRGIYAGSVGHFDYSGGMDTCIAIRTMLFKDGYVHLQAGGGIVYDSVPLDEYNETLAKLSSNLATIEKAEYYYMNE